MKKQAISLLIIVGFITLNAQNAMPKKDGNIYSLNTKSLYFEVNAAFGGHFSSFKIDGQEILYFSGDPEDYLVGSTLWTSPQGVWNWPPSAELDREQYEATITGNTIEMVSRKDPASGLVFKKSFSANKKSNCIDITYEIFNKGDDACEVAAWEVTRVPSQGSLSFFPLGEPPVWGTNSFEKTTEISDGIVWYQQKKSDPIMEKFFSDGSEGWLAHVTKDGYLFLKTFGDIPKAKQAPGEAEIELYYKNEVELIELENQSAYVNIPAGDSMVYKVKWLGTMLPSSINVSIGSKALIEYVRDLAKKNTVK
jgi:hypothetical protein